MWHSDLLKEIKEYLKKFNITITSLNDFSIEKKQDTAKVQYDESKGIVTLNIGKFSPIEKEEFNNFIQKAHDNKATLIEAKTSENLEIIAENEKIVSKSEIIKMLTGVANDNDLAAIRMSLHMKTHHDKENKVIVSRMKQEICQKFGDRGKNISNLCTAGYFESFVIPLLQECRSNTALNDDVFKSYFNIIIEESAFSIFVNSRMSQDDVVTKIKEQIEKNTKYGIHYLVIHGIGETNVKNISHALADLENEKVIAIKTLDRSKSNIIRASCEYGKKILTTES